MAEHRVFWMKGPLGDRERTRSYTRGEHQRGPGRIPYPLKCGASLVEARLDPGKDQRTPTAEAPAILW